MNIENTADLKKWILNKSLTQQDKINLEEAIYALSEYIVSINPDYLYNKTYITSYISDFFECNIMLKRKYKIIEKRIIPMLIAENVDMSNVIVRIDEIWTYFRGEYILSNNFNPSVAKNPNIKLELKYISNDEYVVAEYIERNSNFQENIERCVRKFISRLGELTNEEKI